MTRINVVLVDSLEGVHLCAEYRELPRVFALAHKASVSSKPWTDKQPKEYCLSTGHVVFWYDKLGFLAKRHKALVAEMLSRGYKPTMTTCLKEQWQDKIPGGYWKDYVPTEAALKINQERIDKRLSGDKS
jgi:deoxyribonuclease (pyrimidine dimer)